MSLYCVDKVLLVKALVQVDFPVYVLSKQKQNKQTGQNGYVHKAVILSKINILA